MKRTIVQPANLTGTPLAECKEWLGISRPNEDSELTALLSASLDLCEAYTSQIPLEVSCEEVLPGQTGWQCLSTRPVRAILSVSSMSETGEMSPISISDYEVEIGADGRGFVRQSKQSEGKRIAVGFVAGLAQDWSDLPDAIRHGIIRTTAHLYRDRDASKSLEPPASAAALWRPWRNLRVI